MKLQVRERNGIWHFAKGRRDPKAWMQNIACSETDGICLPSLYRNTGTPTCPHCLTLIKGGGKGKRRAPPKRGKKGSIDARRLIGFPDELLAAIDKVAAREGISAAEWVRRACARALVVRP